MAIYRSHFAHQHLRRYTQAFGAMFSNIDVVRFDANDLEESRVAVPIMLSNKEKWVERIKTDPDLKRQPALTLPRMAYEIVGMAYNPERKLNRLHRVTLKTPEGNTSTYAPTTWDIEMNLYIATKTQEDMLQIVEQILPAFEPDYNLELVGVKNPEIRYIVPVTLLDVMPSDSYEGHFEDRRVIIWTLSFMMKAYLFGPVRQGSLIKKVTVNVSDYKSDVAVIETIPYIEGVPLDQIMKTDNWTTRVTIEEV